LCSILLIEDEARLRENISELLELHDHQVTTADNGLAGLHHLDLFTPDIILCDVMMPVINGLDFLIRLKKDEQRKSIPVILLSAKVDSEDVEAGLFLGADDFLKKPFKISELVDKINKILSIS